MSDPTGDSTPQPAEDVARASPAPAPGIGDEPIRPDPQAPERPFSEAEAALERERWLRAQFEREHQVTMSVMRILLGSVREQSRRMHFWRWLIDDLRSERRRQEALYRTDGQVDSAFGRRPWTW
ncbi:hypothetical protein MWN33_15425 [Starkeya koreensis]|uniref:Uncharacterized protein n=1 Tax=Ancylobacter koreensis TaxID=266121 RepID=A0ABT0DQF9_9HYPH|nr:hypothetical protein [Ancylobacter koreensis]MCK0209424.1 hypothetical protein [Ancylobacter koreensis]